MFVRHNATAWNKGTRCFQLAGGFGTGFRSRVDRNLHNARAQRGACHKMAASVRAGKRSFWTRSPSLRKNEICATHVWHATLFENLDFAKTSLQVGQTLSPITTLTFIPNVREISTLIRARCLAIARTSASLAILMIVAAGCTRQFYRDASDRDVEGLLEEKSSFQPDNVAGWYVYPDKRARFADFDRHMDRPRKPPDDPTAAALAPDPQPFRSKLHSRPDQEGQGYLEFLRHCDQANRDELAQNPMPSAKLGDPTRQGSAVYVTPAVIDQTTFEAALKTNEPAFLINLEQALELSLFNSREFQDRREDLYLSALPVTLQRFSFMTQFFAGMTAVRSWTGSEFPGGPGTAWNINSTGAVNQLFPTGASAVARLANQLVIDLGTGNPTVGLSNLTLDIVQPLLRDSGWAVTLEPLTQAERNLVYGVRSYARFRKNYYVFIAGGGELFNSPFSFAGLNLRGVGPSLSSASQGYLPTLLTAALERNERENIRALNNYLALYREYQGRGDFSELQVGQVEQSILRGQGTLLTRQKELQDNLDGFKLQLGLPTRLPLELDATPTKPMTKILVDFAQARTEFQSLRNESDQFRTRYRNPLLALAGSAVSIVPLDIPIREMANQLVLDSSVTRATKKFRTVIKERWDWWKTQSPVQLQANLKSMTEEFRTLQVEEARFQARNETFSTETAARLASLPRDIAIGQLEFSIREYEAARDKKENTPRGTAVLYESVVNDFIRVMSEAREERQELLRESWPKLPGMTIEGADLLTEDLDRAQAIAAQVALANRPELMNSRGQMIDAWRRVGVVANSLLGVLNVGYNLNTNSPGHANEAFNVGGSRARHQLILNGELPLVRRAERNEYRTALIAYQRARRNLQATEDFILNEVRTDLRNLRVLAENYRIQQRAVEVAFDQVENSLDVLQSPPIPDGAAGQPGRAAAQGQQQAANAASLTQQLLSAQSSLLQAQNGLYQAWVNFLVARMTMYRDIEQMPLDPRGAWIDEQFTSPAIEPDKVPQPGAVGTTGAGRFAELRTAGDR